MPLHFLTPPGGIDALEAQVTAGFRSLGVDVVSADEGDAWVELVHVNVKPKLTALLLSFMEEEHLLAPALSEAVGGPVLALLVDPDGEFEDGNQLHLASAGRLVASSRGWHLAGDAADALVEHFGATVRAGDTLEDVADALGVYFAQGREGDGAGVGGFDWTRSGDEAMQKVMSLLDPSLLGAMREEAQTVATSRSLGLRATEATTLRPLRAALEWGRSRPRR